MTGAPVRLTEEAVPPRALRAGRTRSSSAPARTGWRRRSRSPRRGAPCWCSRRRRRSAAARAREELTAAGLPPRRLLGDPPARRRLALPAPPAAARARARARASGGPARPPARRRERGRAAPVGRGDGRRPRRRRAAPTAGSWGRSPTRGRSWSDDLLGPPLRPPRHPVPGRALRPARPCAPRPDWRDSRFSGERARALLAGNAAHSMRPLDGRATAAFGLMLLLLGHGVGWPAAVGGSQAIADALASLLRSLGGEIETDSEVRSLDELRGARSVLFDLTPRQILAIAGDALPARYRRALARYRYGPGVFKLDYALDGPVPWTAEACRGAGTVHVGGTLEEIAAAEAEVARGGHPQRPFVLVAQQSVFDPTRAPAGAHTLWAYCHVPNGSNVDMTDADRAADRAVRPRLPRSGPGAHRDGPGRRGGAQRQLRRRRHQRGAWPTCARSCCGPSARPNPYTTPNPRLFLCSSSTPPGGGVHGMCGWHAARAALARRPPVRRTANPEGARRAACTASVGDVAVGSRRSSGGRHRRVAAASVAASRTRSPRSAAGSRESTFGSTRPRATHRSPET